MTTINLDYNCWQSNGFHCGIQPKYHMLGAHFKAAEEVPFPSTHFLSSGYGHNSCSMQRCWFREKNSHQCIYCKIDANLTTYIVA